MNVLIVEDDTQNARVLSLLVQSIDADALVVVDPSVVRAVVTMVRDRIDIAFIDFLLKKDYPLNGIDVATWLHEANPDTVICLVTAFSREEIIGRGFSVPNWLAYLRKPIERDDLARILA